MKRYVAYKVETNFVDVVPQAERLRLSINTTFAEINHPKGLCRASRTLAIGPTVMWRSASSQSTSCPTSWASCAIYERQMGDSGQQ